MAINKALYSSNSDEWETPKEFFNKVNREFHFDYDICASDTNTKVKTSYKTKEQNSLICDWSMLLKDKNNFEPFIWCNPPYSEIKQWVEKSYKESLKGCTIVMLIPSRTDTKYWHDYCVYGQIRYIKGRLKFNDSKNSAPFPSCLVIFSRRYNLIDKNNATLAQHFYIDKLSYKQT
jgi:phage N-6-adenine-methyltransferase